MRLRRHAGLAVGLVLVASLLPACRDAPRAQPVPFQLPDNDGTGSFDAPVGTVGIFGLVNVVVEAPTTVLRVRPLRTDPGVDVVAVRAVFHGNPLRSRTSPSGHLVVNGSVLITCSNAWPIPGYGWSYPVENLQVARGDDVAFVLYARSLLPGRRTASGYRIDYQMPGRPPASVSSSNGTLEMWLHRPGEPPTTDHKYAPCDGEDSNDTKRMPGFPP